MKVIWQVKIQMKYRTNNGRNKVISFAANELTGGEQLTKSTVECLNVLLQPWTCSVCSSAQVQLKISLDVASWCTLKLSHLHCRWNGCHKSHTWSFGYPRISWWGSGGMMMLTVELRNAAMVQPLMLLTYGGNIKWPKWLAKPLSSSWDQILHIEKESFVKFLMQV